MSQMFLNVVSTFKGDGIQQANKQLSTFGKQTSSFGSILGKAATALASFGLAAKGIQFSRESITAARDLERNLYALDTIFTDLAPGMRQFAIDAENLGLSQSKAAKASTFIGSVLKQSGFAMEDVAKETKNLVELGTDLAALYGYDVQEALLGMTALFRGEYDPIEKFGVAMKQSEINSELAARGQDKLEGAARRNAEQTVRLELLYQRAADAMGAFTAQSGSLYTEQKKLGATFENVQAQLGTALLPAIVGVNEELRKMLVEATPGLIEIFNGLAEGLETLVGIFRDAMDPTTDLGESFAALGIQFNSLYETIFGTEFNLSDIFEAGAVGLGIFIDLLHDLMRFIELVVIHLQVAGQAINDFFTDPVKFNNTNYVAMREELIAISNGAKEIRLNNEKATDAIKTMRESVETADKAKLANLKQQIRGVGVSARESANEVRRMRMLAGLSPIEDVVPPVDLDGGTSGGGGGGGGSSATTRSTREGFLPTPEADAIRKAVVALGETTTKQRNATIKAVKEQFAAQAALSAAYGDSIEQARLAAEAASLAAEEAAKQQLELARIAEETAKQEAEALAERERVYNSFLDSVKNTFAGIKNSIMGAFDLTQLGGSTNAITRNMDKLLTRMRAFATNVSKLSSMGLNPALLQQVISAGPLAGARLAQSLVSGGAGALGAINAGFGEFGSLAGQIAQTGTGALFNTPTQQSIYNIEVSGGLDSSASIGQAIVEAIKAYERTSGAIFVKA
jgi:hypothetical protein